MTVRAALLLVGMMVAALFVWLIARTVEWNAVRSTLAAAEMGWLLLALCALACDYALRIERWRRMLARRNVSANFLAVAPSLLAGFALNNVLPLRAGDFARTLLAKGSLGVPLSVAVGTVLVERVFDLVVVMAALALGAWAVANSSLPLPMIIVITGLSVTAVAGLVISTLFGHTLARRVEDIGRRIDRIPRVFRFIASLLDTLAALTGLRAITSLMLLSVLVWTCEGMIIVFCAWALGLTMPWLGAALILAGANLGTLLPGAPGHFGTFHYFAMASASALAFDSNSAVALAILVHAVIWLPITLVGGLFATASLRILPALFQPARMLRGADVEKVSKRGCPKH